MILNCIVVGSIVVFVGYTFQMKVYIISWIYLSNCDDSQQFITSKRFIVSWIYLSNCDDSQLDNHEVNVFVSWIYQLFCRFI
jgi:hypothetical protein